MTQTESKCQEADSTKYTASIQNCKGNRQSYKTEECQSVMGFFCFVLFLENGETQKSKSSGLKFVPLMVGLELADQEMIYYGIVLCQNHCLAT